MSGLKHPVQALPGDRLEAFAKHMRASRLPGSMKVLWLAGYGPIAAHRSTRGSAVQNCSLDERVLVRPKASRIARKRAVTSSGLGYTSCLACSSRRQNGL